MPAETMIPVTPKQIRLIHALKSSLQMPDAAYRSMLWDFRVFSSKHLSSDQAELLIWDLRKAAERRRVWVRPERKYNELAGRPGMATPKQLRMIEAMWADVSHAPDAASRAAALNAFLERFGARKMEDVEYWQVSKIVNALKTMKSAGGGA